MLMVFLTVLMFSIAYYLSLDLIARPSLPQGKFIAQLSFSAALFVLGVLLAALTVVVVVHEYFRVHSMASIVKLSRIVKTKRKRR